MEITATAKILPMTHIDYLGNQMSMDNKEFLQELNKKFDMTIEHDSKEQVKENISTSKEHKPFSKANKSQALNAIMTHNVFKNLPTQEIFKILGAKA